jgi:hypothetical protein
LQKSLFIIAKLWKQPRCPKTDEWIKKMWYIYTMDYHSIIKKNEITLFAGVGKGENVIVVVCLRGLGALGRG